MFIVSVYRPEADEFLDDCHPAHPFSGIEILGAADTAEGADEIIDQYQSKHPEWIFRIEELQLPEGFAYMYVPRSQRV